MLRCFYVEGNDIVCVYEIYENVLQSSPFPSLSEYGSRPFAILLIFFYYYYPKEPTSIDVRSAINSRVIKCNDVLIHNSNFVSLGNPERITSLICITVIGYLVCGVYARVCVCVFVCVIAQHIH